jgi:hypothetical protein
MLTGNIKKLESKLEDPISYQLPIGNEKIKLNSLLGKLITLNFTGTINCIATGEKIKKTYAQGYSYKSFITLPECDICIVRPELCHFDKGTCRDEEWGKNNCFNDHIVYLALTPDLKVGITRQTQVPTRWIDQGATQALPILKVPNRKLAGEIEVELKQEFNDRTNWRKMLQGNESEFDLIDARETIFENFGSFIDSKEITYLEEDIVDLIYPIISYPEKVKSLSLDKSPNITGVLKGIKGQYLILDTGVLNIRKHQGYFIEIIIN